MLDPQHLEKVKPHPSQLVALTTFSDLVPERMQRVKNDYPESRNW